METSFVKGYVQFQVSRLLLTPIVARNISIISLFDQCDILGQDEKRVNINGKLRDHRNSTFYQY